MPGCAIFPRVNRLLIIFIALALPALVCAQDLYRGEVVWDGAGEPAAEDFRRALAQVINRLTGSGRIPDGLSAARIQVGWQLREIEIPPAEADAEAEVSRRLVVDFDPRMIDQAIRRAGLPRWGHERPELLIWMAISRAGQAELVGPGAEYARLRFMIHDTARRRGVPVVLPLMDALDLGQVTPADVRGGITEGALAAADRYGADGVVLVDLRRAEDTWTGRWRWRVGGHETGFTYSAGSRDEAVTGGMQRLADLMTQRFAVIASGSPGRVRLRVTGMQREVHYAELMRYLRELSITEAVNVLAARDDRLDLTLELNAGGLRETLALSRLFEFVSEDPASGDLEYRLRW